MRVVIATPLYPPDIGGPATDASSLVSYLEKNEKEIKATVCQFGRVRHLPKLIRHIAYGFILAHASRGADCVVVFDTVSVGLPAMIVSKIMRVPFIVRVPGDYAWEQGVQRFGVKDSIDEFQNKKYGFRVELLRAVQNFVVRNALRVLAPSEYFKKIIFGWGVKKGNVKRIYLGLDFTTHTETPASVPDGKIIFSAGRLVPWKGFSMLLHILPELPEWKLVIAGDGPLKNELYEQAQKLDILDRVIFTGSLSRAQIVGWLKTADVFVLNTSFESFSFQIVEAMASGIPVITTPVGSIPELIENGVNGILCHPNNEKAFKEAILSVATEQELWVKRIVLAKEKTGQFTSGKAMEELVKDIKNICA